MPKPENQNSANSTDDLDQHALYLRDLALRKASHHELEKRVADSSRDLAESNIRLLREITERREAENELRQLNRHNRLLLDSAGEGIYGVDTLGRCTFINKAALKMLRYSALELQGAPMQPIVHRRSNHTETKEWPVSKVITTGKGCRIHNEVFRRQNGETFSVEYSSYPVVENDVITGAVVVFRDVTEEREMADRLSFQATHDSLTDLINRREFELRVGAALEEAHVDNTQHAVFFLDLDQFKIVNDTCGHSAGDELLRQLANKLQTKLRSSDTLARLGGDEFGVLLKNCPLDTAIRIAENLRQSVENFRFIWNKQSFAVGVSIGVVPVSKDTDTLTRLMSAADAACYAAKDSGRNRIHTYEPDDEELEQRRGQMQWATKIRGAYDHDRFVLYYQPIVPVNDCGKLSNYYEVLVRMLDENHKLVPPGLFMPAADRYQLMPQIDRWVVSRTIEWLGNHPEHLKQLVHCGINLSGATLTDNKFLTYIKALIDYSPVPADKICLEITETAAVQDLQKASAFILELQELGLSLCTG